MDFNDESGLTAEQKAKLAEMDEVLASYENRPSVYDIVEELGKADALIKECNADPLGIDIEQEGLAISVLKKLVDDFSQEARAKIVELLDASKDGENGALYSEVVHRIGGDDPDSQALLSIIESNARANDDAFASDNESEFDSDYEYETDSDEIPVTEDELNGSYLDYG